MELANINISPAKVSTTTQTVKKTAVQTEDKGFSKILKTAKEETKVQESALEDRTVQAPEKQKPEAYEDVKDSALKAEDLAVKEAEENSKDLSEILELLITLSGDENLKSQLFSSLQKGSLKEVKALVSELLTGGLKSLNPECLIQLKQLITGKQIEATAFNTEDLKQMAASLTDKLTTQSNFKTELSKLLETSINNDTTTYIEASTDTLKVELVNKLSDMLKKDSIEETNTTLSKEKALEQGNVQIAAQNTSKEADTQGRGSESFRDSQLSKEDKLLKDLLVSKDKGKSDPITDKISNIINRFESLRLDKAAEVQEKPVITRANFNLDFVRAVKFMDANSIKELSVKVIPKDLGEIVIRLTMDNGVMKANVTAANKETYNLLNSQIQTISNQLSEQNMSIQSFSLSLGSGENFMFSGSEGGQQDGRQQGRGSFKAISLEEEIVKDDGYNLDLNNVNLLA